MSQATQDYDVAQDRADKGWTRSRMALVLVGVAVFLTLLRYAGLLPDALFRVPEAMIPPFAIWLDVIFNFVKDDLGLLKLTRFLTGGLEALLDTTGNLLYGKRRWPNLGPIPWTSVAAVAAVLGYYLGGWRIAALAGGTFIWTALIGQWEIAMETMSVLVVAAPMAFVIGITLGILAWRKPWVDAVIKPVLSVLQTLPFFTYLLPAVIFFKVGPTAGAVATTIYAIPPMILMTTLGLQKVPAEVVEAGEMSGCSRWQLLRHVYIPSARSEILVGVNQVIMLCLAMVVLTAFIGMPGLGAKLLAMMGSFKLGRSFEIGVTIVLLAVTLDRLSNSLSILKKARRGGSSISYCYLASGCSCFSSLSRSLSRLHRPLGGNRTLAKARKWTT
jgi:glycine betaine/proline transport system permease protein